MSLFVNNSFLVNSDPPLMIYVHTSVALGQVLTNYVATLRNGIGQPCHKCTQNSRQVFIQKTHYNSLILAETETG